MVAVLVRPFEMRNEFCVIPVIFAANRRVILMGASVQMTFAVLLESVIKTWG